MAASLMMEKNMWYKSIFQLNRETAILSHHGIVPEQQWAHSTTIQHGSSEKKTSLFAMQDVYLVHKIVVCRSISTARLMVHIFNLEVGERELESIGNGVVT